MLKENMFYQRNNFLENNAITDNLKIKEIKYREQGILYINHWPKYKNYSEQKLINIIESLNDYLTDQEIPFFGISIEDNFNKKEPLLVVHLLRESRAFDIEKDFPSSFENLDVIGITLGKHKQYEYK